MILDMIKTAIGVLPFEYEFIYYVVLLGVCMCVVFLPLIPIILLFRKSVGRR